MLKTYRRKKMIIWAYFAEQERLLLRKLGMPSARLCRMLAPAGRLPFHEWLATNDDKNE